MRYEFKLPDIGEGVIEGEITRWLVKEGDPVAADQPLVEVMTDKATVVIPSPKAGRVLERRGEEGATAKVHETLVVLDVGEGAAAAKAPPVERPPAAVAPPPMDKPPAPVPPLASKPEARAPAPPPAPPAGHVRATPVTRRIAAEHGLDLSTVEGSGPGGRVLKSDVMALVGAGAAPRLPAGPEEIERIPLRGVRKKIAENMQRSKRTAAHFTFVEQVDCTRLVEVRRRINEARPEGTPKVSFLPFIVKAVIEGLRRYPALNASVDDEKGELILKHFYNVGVAAATPEGLIVPVIHGADRMSVRGLAEEIGRLAGEARAGRSRLEDLRGGTFTITSLGELGGLFATPIINHPEVAILGIHRIRPTPVVRDGQIVVRDVMHVACAFDHRVIDGALGAQFTYEVIRYLENPELFLLELS